MDASNQQKLLRNRLLNDIADLQHNPYPGINLHIQDETALQQACLVLTPSSGGNKAVIQPPLHLTIFFNADYPLSAPEVTIQSAISHPNVQGDYICASILNTEDGYASAYTLKGICIQLLSFFCSEKVEQDWGGVVDMRDYWRGRDGGRQECRTVAGRVYRCKDCGFGGEGIAVSESTEVTAASERKSTPQINFHGQTLTDLPSELLLLLITEHLDEATLLLAARAWNSISCLIQHHNILRTRSLQCFTLKETFHKNDLGVGVHIHNNRALQSEFDLLSSPAFFDLGVRKSVQGLQFEHWLPLPISQTHWLRVRGGVVDEALNGIACTVADIRGPKLVNVLYTFMNDITVRLSTAASDAEERSEKRRFGIYGEQKSTLTHASEKAIESYFHLFHLLLCLAVDRPSIAQDANDMIEGFPNGKRDKQTCPNLGHLLIMVLISTTSIDASETKTLTRAIITEAITRNVVWMLDKRGAGMAELSFMETDEVSEYRLQRTFQASKISYRLLMFSNLLRKCMAASPTTTTTDDDDDSSLASRPTLTELRDKLFKRHGAPPDGSAARLAQSIREIQKVDSFPEFLAAMDIESMPSKEEFTAFMRRTVRESMEKGYSIWALPQEEALGLRLKWEPEVGSVEGVRGWVGSRRGGSFFPGQGRGRRGGGGRERGRGWGGRG